MQKVIIDSSTWVSYFLGIKKNAPSYQNVSKIIQDAKSILVPEIIYIEVLNVLNRLHSTESLLADVKRLFSTKKFRKYLNNYQFWFEKLEIYSQKTKLETQDLIIFASVFENWPCDLITSDKKLQDAYDFFKKHYEKK